jgi:hypothetical protein
MNLTHRDAALANANNVVTQLQRIQAQMDGKTSSLADAIAVNQLQASLAIAQALLALVEQGAARNT